MNVQITINTIILWSWTLRLYNDYVYDKRDSRWQTEFKADFNWICLGRSGWLVIFHKYLQNFIKKTYGFDHIAEKITSPVIHARKQWEFVISHFVINIHTMFQDYASILVQYLSTSLHVVGDGMLPDTRLEHHKCMPAFYEANVMLLLYLYTTEHV